MALLGLTSANAQGNRPNFVVLFTDDQQCNAIGYNNPEISTPNLDQLAADGLIFDRAYIASPICMASRASMMTGVFPQQHGAVALDQPSFVKNVVEEKRYPTLPQLLTAAGYDTAFCGKSHLGPPRDYGFAEGKEHPEYHDDPAFAFANEFVRSRNDSSKPFFLWVATHQPHVPLLPEDSWVAKYADKTFTIAPNFMITPPQGSIYNQGVPGESFFRDSEYTRNYEDVSAGPPRDADQIQTFMRGYYAIISRLDAQFGVLMATLKQSGHWENTVVIFLSDNGYLLGNHGLGNKITMHEESVRVPMFIRTPAMPIAGTRSDGLVSSLDVFPTVLALAGVERPEHLAGKSLVPVLEGREKNVREVVASECVGVSGTVGQGHRMVRTVQWKYVLTDVNEEYLFDESADPFELQNLASSPSAADVLGEMRAHMAEWMDSIRDGHTRPPK